MADMAEAAASGTAQRSFQVEGPLTAGGIRVRARRELTAAIKAAARRQLAAGGSGELSLRGIARELGMASSAIYRYFASRDELITALVIDAYDDLGAAAEAGLAAASDAAPHEQWVRVCGRVRQWAFAHPHEYALIYGTPVPGYQAPSITIGPASRVGLVLANIVAYAQRTGQVADVPVTLPVPVARDADRLAAALELAMPPAVVAALVAAWAQLFGLISFELFGQFEQVVWARDAFFDHAAGYLARSVGLTPSA